MADRSISFTLLGKADSATKAFGQVEKSVDGLRGKIEKLAPIAKAALGALALKLGKDTVDAASQAEQSIGATQSVFGGFASQVIDRSNQAAKAFGLSANGYRESANLIGSLLKNQGVSMDQLAGKTDSMIGTASNLAATFGGSTKDAVDALSSAFKGEFDPLERYGISIKQSTVNEELAAQGKDKLTGAALKQAQQQAITNLITDQASDSAGAFANQTNTLAEKQQIMGAQVENIKAKLGDKLLPVVGKAVDGFSQLLDFFDRNSAILIPLTGGILGLSTAVYGINKAADIYKDTQRALNGVMEANPIFRIITLVSLLATGLVIAYEKSETFRDIVNGAFNVVKNVAQTVADFFTQDIPKAFHAVADAARKVIDWFKDHWPLLLGILTGPFGLAVGEIVKHRDQIVHFFEEIGPKLVSALARVGDILLAPFKAGFSAVAHLWNDTVGKLHFGIPDWVPVIGGKEFSMPKIPEFANGGTVRSAGVALVGEEGPELVRLPAGAHVFPTDRTLQALQGRSVANVNAPELHVHFDGPVIGGSRADARQLADFLKDELRRIAVFQQRVGHPDAAAFATAFGV